MDFSQIKNLGQAKSVLDNLPRNPLQLLLEDQMNEVIDALRNSVAKHDLDASGDLKSSFVTTKPNFSKGTLEIGVEANYYYKFLDQGVNGAKINRGAPNWGSQTYGSISFRQAIDDWIRFRGITPKGKIYRSSYDSLNFLVRRSIVEKGKEPTFFVAEAINNRMIENMSTEITNLVGRSIEVLITLQHS